MPSPNRIFLSDDAALVFIPFQFIFAEDLDIRERLIVVEAFNRLYYSCKYKFKEVSRSFEITSLSLSDLIFLFKDI
jgi:hypothetical protein